MSAALVQRNPGAERSCLLLLAGVTMVILLGISRMASAGEPLPCPERAEVRVVFEEPHQHRLMCEAAGEAIDFLAVYGLVPQRPIVIEIVEDSINHLGYLAYGSYDSRTDKIGLMSYRSIMASSAVPFMYGEPFDEVHYRGAVAHEVAHAVVQHNLQEKPISPAPQEYLAHATQLGTLPEERRRQIIARAATDPWLPGDTISDIYMALNPTGFAVKSYLHLTGSNKPLAFVDILINSKWFYVYVPD